MHFSIYIVPLLFGCVALYKVANFKRTIGGCYGGAFNLKSHDRLERGTAN
jgi:hypothetical protein